MERKPIISAQQPLCNCMTQHLALATDGEVNYFSVFKQASAEYLEWLNIARGNSLDGHFTHLVDYAESEEVNSWGTIAFTVMGKTDPSGNPIESSMSLAGSWTYSSKSGESNNHMWTLLSGTNKKGDFIPTSIVDFGQILVNSPSGEVYLSEVKHAWQHESRRSAEAAKQEALRKEAVEYLKLYEVPKFDSPYAVWSVALTQYELGQAENDTVSSKWEAMRSKILNAIVQAGFAGNGYFQLLIIGAVSNLVWRPAARDAKGKYLPYNTLNINVPVFQVWIRRGPKEPNHRNTQGLLRTLNLQRVELSNEIESCLGDSFALAPEIESRGEVVEKRSLTINIVECVQNINNDTLIKLVRKITGKGFDYKSSKKKIVEALEGYTVTLEDLIEAWGGNTEHTKTMLTLKALGVDLSSYESAEPQASSSKPEPQASSSKPEPQGMQNFDGDKDKEDVLAMLQTIFTKEVFESFSAKEKGYICYKFAKVGNHKAEASTLLEYFNNPVVIKGELFGYAIADIKAGVYKMPLGIKASLIGVIKSGSWKTELGLAPATSDKVRPSNEATVKTPKTEVLNLNEGSTVSVELVDFSNPTEAESTPDIYEGSTISVELVDFSNPTESVEKEEEATVETPKTEVKRASKRRVRDVIPDWF